MKLNTQKLRIKRTKEMFENNHKKTILADNLYLTMDTRISHINNNVMVVGSSGRGKTRNFIKPNIMQMNSNYVISDPKGVLIEELGTMLVKNGYKIKLLNLVDMQHSNTYNPFHYLKSERDMYKMLDFLIANTDPINASYNDPFWVKSEKALISAICFYLMEECNPDDKNFNSVMKLLRCVDAGDGADERESVLDVLMNDVREKNPDSLAVKQYAIFKSAGSGKTAQSILISCQVRLQYFNLDEYINLTSSDNLELEKLSEEKTALFVIISDTDRSQNWLAGLFYSQLFDILCQKENNYHIRFILDDFVCTGKIPEFDYKIAMIRSRNLSCLVVIQDEAQLEKEYGLAARGIITNCESYVFLGASNVEACADVAKRICKYGIKAEDIIDMSYDKCVVIAGNKRGIYRKYDIKKHPKYSQIADEKDSPLYYEYKKEFFTQRVYCLSVGSDLKTTSYRRKLKKEMMEKNGQESVVKKGGLFDSPEEEYLYDILKNITNLFVIPHQHLIDLFSSSEKEISKKLSYMHCDFALYDNRMKLLLGIEIDGSQHLTDVTQIKNDRFKNNIFAQNEIPLLRFTARDVRRNTAKVIEDIIQAVDLADILENHRLNSKIEAFSYENYKSYRYSYKQNKDIKEVKEMNGESFNLNEFCFSDVFETGGDIFYSKENMEILERRIADIDCGKSILKVHV